MLLLVMGCSLPRVYEVVISQGSLIDEEICVDENDVVDKNELVHVLINK